MTKSPMGETRWLKRLLLMQVLLSLAAVLVVAYRGVQPSLAYSMGIGLVPAALALAYLRHIPYSSVALQAYSASIAAIGALVLLVLLVEQDGAWLNTNRLLLCAQVAVAAVLALNLSNRRSTTNSDSVH